MQIVKYLSIIIFILFLIYEALNLFKLLNNNLDDKLIRGKVLKVESNSSYIRANLYLSVLLNGENNSISVESDFRNSLRWWLQPKPKISDEIYFYIKSSNTNFQMGNIPKIYGLSIDVPCTKSKKMYDLLYDYFFSKSILIFAIVLISVLIAISLNSGNHDGSIDKIILILLLLRLFFGSVIL